MPVTQISLVPTSVSVGLFGLSLGVVHAYFLFCTLTTTEVVLLSLCLLEI